MYDYDDVQEAAFESGIDFDPFEWGAQQAELGYLVGPQLDPYPSSDQPPETDYGRWVTTQGDIPASETAGSGWPGAVPIRPANWNMDTDPDSYKIAWGDTYAGLAATYLGTPQRWREIWDQQPDMYRASRSADRIMPGEWIFMPPDASATLRAALGEPPETGDRPAPAPPGGYPAPVGPPPPPGGPPPAGVTAPSKKKKKNYLPWIIGGGAVAALAAYALS